MRLKLVTIVLFVFALNANSQTISDSLSFRLDEYFSALTTIGKFNGNVLIAQNNTVILDKSYNLSGVSDSLKINRDSKFIIASVSKVFIKFSILKLVELQKLSLDDKLNKFIPDFPQGDKITLDHLIHHRSGLPREFTAYENYDNISLQQVVGLAKKEKLQFEPGTKVLYSNVGYLLLHYIIDITSDHGYLAFIQKELFDKMNLKNTFEYNSANSISNFAMGFDRENGKIIPSSKISINRFETGNYVSTIGDLYSFSQQILAGEALKQSLAMEIFKPDSLIEQAGGRPGYRAYFYMNLKTHTTFIFLANFSDIPFQETTAGIMNILNHEPYEIPHKLERKEVKISKDLLKQYAGKYSLDADRSQIFTIEVGDNGLVVTDSDGEKINIHPDSDTTFFDAPDSNDGYIFIKDSKTGEYQLSIISTGVKLTTTKLK